MFGLFRNKKMDLYAPVKGECIAIEDVPDPVFSNKLLGDGIAFKPLNNTIFSPHTINFIRDATFFFAPCLFVV